jgi:hypothetical protein
MKKYSRVFAFVFIASLFVVGSVQAKKDNIEQFEPKMVCGDGKDGRRWAQFNQVLPDFTYYEVRVKMRRVSGGNETFVNLRFGRDGQTLDGSKRVYLRDDKVVEETWRFDRIRPGNKPLVLNAYNGEVEVLRVRAVRDW